MERRAIAVHRYEGIDLDLGTLEGPDDLLAALTEALAGVHGSLGPGSDALRAVVARIRLVGSNARHAEIVEGLARDGGIERHTAQFDGVRYGWEPSIRDATTPALDLAALAASGDIVAPLAAAVLDGGAAIDAHLLELVRRRIEREVLTQTAFRQDVVGPVATDDDALRELVLAAAADVLQDVERMRGAR